MCLGLLSLDGQYGFSDFRIIASAEVLANLDMPDLALPSRNVKELIHANAIAAQAVIPAAFTFRIHENSWVRALGNRSILYGWNLDVKARIVLWVLRPAVKFSYGLQYMVR